MLRLRSQIARGKVRAARATPRNLAWLFSPDLPKEIAWRVFAYWNLPRTVNGTGHTGPSEFCATSI